MNVVQIVAGLLLEAVLHSVVLGAVCWALFQLLSRIFHRASAPARFLLCNSAQLMLLLVFVQPFLTAAVQWGHAPPVSLLPLRQVVSTVAQGAATAAANPHPAAAAATSWQEWAQLWVVAAYFTGLLLFILRFLRSYYGTIQLKSRQLSAPDERWQAAMALAVARLGIRKNLRLCFSGLVQSPCIVGWAKAVVLIPVSLANRLSTDQAEAILLHELTHYRLLHHYINIAAQLAAALQFFNPFVWLLMRSGNQYREWICDEAAARHSREVALSEGLLIIAQAASATNPLALTLTSSSGPFFHRIQNLLLMKSKPVSSRSLVITFSLGLAAAVGTYSRLSADPAPRGAAIVQATDSLASISRQMQLAGKNNFILVEALRDSIIHFGRPYSYSVGREGIVINGKPLPEPYLSRYRTLLKNFDTAVSWSISSDGPLTRAELFDSTSWFRKTHISRIPDDAGREAAPVPKTDEDGPGAASLSQGNSALLAYFRKEGLIDTLQPALLQAEDGVVYVNGQGLRPAQKRRIEEIFTEKEKRPVTIKDGYQCRLFPEGVVMPTLYSEKSTISFPPNDRSVPYVINSVNPKASYDPELFELLQAAVREDGLTDSQSSVHISYTTGGIVINNNHLTGAQETKYRSLLSRMFGFTKPTRRQDLLDLTF